MAASQQHQHQRLPQHQLQSPAQLGDGKTPGSSTAGPNQAQGLQVGLPGDASQQLAGHGPHCPTPNQSAAAENGQTDPTPQHDTQSYHAVNNAMSASMVTTDKFDEATLSAEERDRLAAEWKANGKPLCASCKKKHPPPCDTARVQELASIKALRDSDPEAYKTQMAAFQAKYHRRKGMEPSRKRKVASSNDIEIPEVDTPAKKGKWEERSNANRGHLSAQQAQANLDRRAADQRDCDTAFKGQYLTAMFSALMQQQGPWAGYNFLVGLYNGTVTGFPAQLQYPVPTYGYQAQPHQSMPTHGYQAQPQHPVPTYGYSAPTYPASTFHSAHAPQTPQVQNNNLQPPNGVRRGQGLSE